MAAVTADWFSALRLQYKGGGRREEEVPCVIEHDFADGRMVDHYYLTPAPAFWNDEGIQSLGNVQSVLFLQQPDGAPWQVLVHEPAMLREVSFDMPEDAFREFLSRCHVILPGEPGFQPL